MIRAMRTASGHRDPALMAKLVPLPLQHDQCKTSSPSKTLAVLFGQAGVGRIRHQNEANVAEREAEAEAKRLGAIHHPSSGRPERDCHALGIIPFASMCLDGDLGDNLHRVVGARARGAAGGASCGKGVVARHIWALESGLRSAALVSLHPRLESRDQTQHSPYQFSDEPNAETGCACVRRLPRLFQDSTWTRNAPLESRLRLPVRRLFLFGTGESVGLGPEYFDGDSFEFDDLRKLFVPTDKKCPNSSSAVVKRRCSQC
jgi:hypothetical protein